MRRIALALVYLLALFTLIRAYTGESMPSSGTYPELPAEAILR